MLNLFSFYKPVIFCGGEFIVNHLALNHSYSKFKKGDKTLYKYSEKNIDVSFDAYFNKNGYLLWLDVIREHNTIALVPWGLKNNFYTKEKIFANGSTASIERVFDARGLLPRRLVKKIYTLIIDDVEYKKTYYEKNGKWFSDGEIPASALREWRLDYKKYV